MRTDINGHGVLDRIVAETPIAVFDFETTGLSPGGDRVIEVSVARVERGKPPVLVLDTLVNPHRPVAATEIHGITDTDVAGAPTFADVANRLVKALSGCVVAAYNVYFDISFLQYELQCAGFDQTPPHLCLMYMRPMLGLGQRCSLGDACRKHGISHSPTHAAADDVLAAAQLMEVYFAKMGMLGISSFADLQKMKKYKFLQSLTHSPLTSDANADSEACAALKPRSAAATRAAGSTVAAPETVLRKRIPALGSYWEALKTVVYDLVVTEEEIEHLQNIRRDLDLKDEEVRVLHARAFARAIAQFIEDYRLDEKEREKLRRLHTCLSRLGWAPGE